MTGTKERKETLLEIETIIGDLKDPLSTIRTKISSISEKTKNGLTGEEKSKLLFRLGMFNSEVETIDMIIDSMIEIVNTKT